MKRNPLRDQATPHKSQHEDVGTTLTPSSLSSGMTVRAVVLGLILALGVALWTLHASFQLRASHLTVSHLPVAALFPFFLVVFVFNGFLKRFAPKRVFT
ncbi:MAG: hypothetical protein HOH43_10840, partial [Candidatus Latescibacteria bacterium]|nr:hypothetical protein [Candidatus Latescibacterota bacterium]